MTEYEMVENPSRVYSDKDLINWTGYHPPTRDEIVSAHEQVRESFRQLLFDMNDLLPEGNDKIEALKAIRNAMYLCNSAIACAQATMDSPYIPFPEDAKEGDAFEYKDVRWVKGRSMWHVAGSLAKSQRRDDKPKVTTRYGDKEWHLDTDIANDRLHVWHNNEWTADPDAVATYHPDFPGDPNHGDTVTWNGEEYVYVGEPGPKNVPLGWAKPMYFKGKQA